MVFGNPIYNWVVQSPVNPKPPGCFHCSLGIQSSWDTHRVGQPGKILSQLANGIFLLRHSGFQGANLARVFAWEQRCFWVSSVNPESWKVFKQKCLKKTWGPASKIPQILCTVCWGSIYLGDSWKKNEISLEPKIQMIHGNIETQFILVDTLQISDSNFLPNIYSRES